MPSTPLSETGDKFAIDEKDSLLLVKIAATLSSPEIYIILKGYNLPPVTLIFLLYQYLKSVGFLWKQLR